MGGAPDSSRLLWNPENVKDVAESVGISTLGEDALRCLSQDVEYRIGQVLTESLRFMRAARRTGLTVQDVSAALRVLNVEPLYGYDSLRPLRYGEAAVGAGQPLFWVEDEEVEFEKLINTPLPKIPRDTSFTAHWLAIDGVQPAIPQNPTTAESRSQDLLPKGVGANPALSALAGNDNVSLKPQVKHIVSKELTLYFDKIQAALLDDNPDEEVVRLRQAALASVRNDPGLQQLVPYFINFVANQVTHHLDDTFTLSRMMELTAALIDNPTLFLDPYASPISASVLTCLMARRVGQDDGRGAAAASAAADGTGDQYRLREVSASLIGRIASRYAASNTLLRSKLTRTCLKYFLDPTKSAAVLYGAISGLSAAGGPEAVRVLVLRNLKAVDSFILQPLRDRVAAAGAPAAAKTGYEMLVGGIVRAVTTMDEAAAHRPGGAPNGANGATVSESDAAELSAFVGPIVADRLIAIGHKQLVTQVLQARFIE